LGVHSLLCIHSKLVVHALLTYGFNRPIAPHRSACNAISAASTQTSCEGTGLCFKLTSIHSRARVTDVRVRIVGNGRSKRTRSWSKRSGSMETRTGSR
jgi:hypothetical protein